MKRYKTSLKEMNVIPRPIVGMHGLDYFDYAGVVVKVGTVKSISTLDQTGVMDALVDEGRGNELAVLVRMEGQNNREPFIAYVYAGDGFQCPPDEINKIFQNFNKVVLS